MQIISKQELQLLAIEYKTAPERRKMRILQQVIDQYIKLMNFKNSSFRSKDDKADMLSKYREYCWKALEKYEPTMKKATFDTFLTAKIKWIHSNYAKKIKRNARNVSFDDDDCSDYYMHDNYIYETNRATN